MTIRLHRLAVVAALAPLTLLTVGCGSDSDSVSPAPGPAATASAQPTTGAPTEPTPAAPATPTAPADPGGVDYVVDGVWRQGDGDVVELPHRDYFSAVIWNGRLVATRTDGEVYAVADVIDADGAVVDTLDTTSAVVVNEAGATLAWVDTDGTVMTAWADDQVEVGEVDLAAPGETIAYSVVAVTGGPSCYEVEDGCIVYLNGIEKPRAFDSHGIDVNPLPSAIDINDVSGDSLATYRDEISDDGSCGGLVDLTRPNTRPEWTTCDYEPAQISPDSAHVIGLPSYYDGLGLAEISVLDAATGDETGRYGASEGEFISQWSWSSDGRVVFARYEGGTWQLMAMSTNGAIAEIGEPVTGEDVDNPFTLIQH